MTILQALSLGFAFGAIVVALAVLSSIHRREERQ